MSSWLEALPVMMAAAVVLFVPGGLVAAAAGARGYRLWALATPLSFTLAGVSAIAVAVIGVPFSITAFAIAVGISVAITLAVRVALRGRSWLSTHPFDEGRETSADLPAPARWSVRVAVAVAIALSATMIGYRIITAVGAPSEIAQLFDNIFHLNATAIIHQTGNGSSLTLGNLTEASAGFYPAAFHDLAAMVMGLGAGDVTVVLNAVSIILASVVWPLSMTFLATRLFGVRVDVIVLTAIVSASLAAFPYRMLSFGVLYPFLAGLALLPVVVALIVEFFGRSRAPRASLAGIVAALAVIAPGVALTHPSVLIAAALFGSPFAVDFLFRSGRSSRTRRWAVTLGAAYLGATAAVFLLIRPTLDTAPWQPSQDYRQAIGSIVTVSPGTGAIAWAMAALLALGLAATARRTRALWPALGVFAIGAVIYFGAAAVTHAGLRDLVSGVWYRDTERAGALLVVGAAPLLVAGGLALTRFCAREVSRVPAIGWGRLAGSISTVMVAGVLLVASAFGPLPQAQEWIRQSFGHDGQALLTDDERALMTSVHELVPTDGVVVGDPFTGASLTPAFAQRTALAPHAFGQRTADEAYLLAHWDEAGTDPKVCPLIAKLNAYWALDFGTYGVYRGQTSILPGTDDAAEIAREQSADSTVTEIARRGDAALFEATACLGE